MLEPLPTLKDPEKQAKHAAAVVALKLISLLYIASGLGATYKILRSTRIRG
jgi:hypothetical protein